MKHTLSFLSIFLFFSNNALSTDLPKDHDERVQEMAKEGYNLIDSIFDNALESLAKKEELMDEQWLSQQKEIRAIQNLLSDSLIIFAFDEGSKNPIPEMLATYVQNKTNEKIPSVFEVDRISSKQVKDFYEFSHTMCKLNGNFQCGRFIRKIESDHFEKMLKLKAQKTAREQLRKEVAQELRDALLFGGYR